MKTWMNFLYRQASALNFSNILSWVDLEADPANVLLDLGCDDGVWTGRLSHRAQAATVYGVEIVPERAAQARGRGISVAESDLNLKLPFESDFFNIVHANQVIEHLHDMDTFVAEIFRILKPGGVAIISTENGSSWHNIAAALMGWQIFSLTNFSKKRSGVGNPLAIHRSEVIELGSWTHKMIFNYRGLKEFFELYGFQDVAISGAGYHPLPARLGRLDVRHSHFITVRARKPRASVTL